MSPACSSAWVSMPAACIDSTSSKAKPLSRSITSTRRLTSVGCGRGTMIPRWLVCASTPAMSSMFWASRRKSSSSITVSANRSTRAGGFANAATGIRPTSRGASHESAAMSSRKSCATRGRCTFTTTSSPVCRRAACTWAIEAAAIGVSSNHSKSSASEPPRSISTTARTSAKASGGTWSRSSLNSVTSSSGKSPSPPEMI